MDDLSQVVDALWASCAEDGEAGGLFQFHPMPSDAAIRDIAGLFHSLVFPGFIGEPLQGSRTALAARVHRLAAGLDQAVAAALKLRPQAPYSAAAIVQAFMAQLPATRERLLIDVRAAYLADPAATGVDEIIMCYPGLYAIVMHRLAHALASAGAPLVPRMLAEFAHRATGVDIHPLAAIGSPFFIDHGTGVVIGATSIIGDNVRIYQGVTLGAISVPEGEARPSPGERRHPTIQSDVTIYANATILGGDTIIGRGCTIGGNAWVTASVPPHTRVVGMWPKAK